uniref:Putative secreted protein n=1 Tax=Psorophora albipes TaxID=869069 RepID=T1DG08_9DIPT
MFGFVWTDLTVFFSWLCGITSFSCVIKICSLSLSFSLSLKHAHLRSLACSFILKNNNSSAQKKISLDCTISHLKL